MKTPHSFASGECTLDMPFQEAIERPGGIVSGSVFMTAADVAKWCKPGVAVPGVLASEVSPEKITWLWDNYIPFGKVTLFDGDPDEGKSLVTIDLAARLTRGWTMPDTSEAGCQPAGRL